MRRSRKTNKTKEMEAQKRREIGDEEVVDDERPELEAEAMEAAWRKSIKAASTEMSGKMLEAYQKVAEAHFARADDIVAKKEGPHWEDEWMTAVGKANKIGVWIDATRQQLDCEYSKKRNAELAEHKEEKVAVACLVTAACLVIALCFY
jgi:hypothetical protein